MTADEQSLWERIAANRIDRGQMLRALAAGATLTALPAAARADEQHVFSFPYYPKAQDRYSPESIPDMLNAMSTVAHFAASALVALLATPDAYGLSGLPLAVVQAAAAAEQYHIDFLASIGAIPTTTSFTVPAGILGNGKAALAAGEVSATIQVAMYMTACRQFAEIGQPEVAKWAYQAGAQEAEQRVAFRFLEALSGATAAVPPNNKAFETDLFLHLRDVLAVYEALGFIGGSGTPLNYPGRDAVLATAGPMTAAVLQKVPNNASSTVTITGPDSLTRERM